MALPKTCLMAGPFFSGSPHSQTSGIKTSEYELMSNLVFRH